MFIFYPIPIGTIGIIKIDMKSLMIFNLLICTLIFPGFP